MLTAYSYPLAKIMDGIVDITLVGDSLGNVILGYNSTRKVTIQDMIRHTQAVKNATKKSMIVTDMPYKSDSTKSLALKNAKALIKAGADAVKIEGKVEIVKHVTKNKIKVMAHVGLLPQTATNFKAKGKTTKEANYILNQAKQLEQAGAFAIVLEAISSKLAKEITAS